MRRFFFILDDYSEQGFLEAILNLMINLIFL
jgi:hypothetical protein